jgi:hypothetical protein
MIPSYRYLSNEPISLYDYQPLLVEAIVGDYLSRGESDLSVAKQHTIRNWYVRPSLAVCCDMFLLFTISLTLLLS